MLNFRRSALTLAALTITASVATVSTQKIAEFRADRAARPIRKIKHIVFIVKENRTFDNYFGTFPGANGATSGTISTGDVIPLGQAPDTQHDINHSFQAAVTAIDGGAMDKFDKISGGADLSGYTQFQEADIPNYFQGARTFVLGDEFFSSLTGPSFPNHLYTAGAQSGGAVNNPGNLHGLGRWGCDSPDDSTVQALDADGNIPASNSRRWRTVFRNEA